MGRGELHHRLSRRAARAGERGRPRPRPAPTRLPGWRSGPTAREPRPRSQARRPPRRAARAGPCRAACGAPSTRRRRRRPRRRRGRRSVVVERDLDPLEPQRVDPLGQALPGGLRAQHLPPDGGERELRMHLEHDAGRRATADVEDRATERPRLPGDALAHERGRARRRLLVRRRLVDLARVGEEHACGGAGEELAGARVGTAGERFGPWQPDRRVHADGARLGPGGEHVTERVDDARVDEASPAQRDRDPPAVRAVDADDEPLLRLGHGRSVRIRATTEPVVSGSRHSAGGSRPRPPEARAARRGRRRTSRPGSRSAPPSSTAR